MKIAMIWTGAQGIRGPEASVVMPYVPFFADGRFVKKWSQRKRSNQLRSIPEYIEIVQGLPRNALEGECRKRGIPFGRLSDDQLRELLTRELQAWYLENVGGAPSDLDAVLAKADSALVKLAETAEELEGSEAKCKALELEVAKRDRQLENERARAEKLGQDKRRLESELATAKANTAEALRGQDNLRGLITELKNELRRAQLSAQASEDKALAAAAKLPPEPEEDDRPLHIRKPEFFKAPGADVKEELLNKLGGPLPLVDDEEE